MCKIVSHQVVISGLWIATGIRGYNNRWKPYRYRYPQFDVFSKQFPVVFSSTIWLDSY